jgi:hypothetical protein
MGKVKFLDEGGSSAPAPTAPTAERFTPEYFAGLGRSAAQGITFGTADEIEAFVRSLVGEETYKQERDKIRAGLDKFRSDFPVEAYGTEIAASVPSGVGLARTLGRLGVKGAMKQAGAGGAAYGAGAAEEMADVPTSAALGGALGIGGEALAPVVSRQAKALGKKIPLTVGQYFPGMKRAEEALTSMPFIGGGIRAQQERGMKAFPVFMYNRALKPLGVELPKNTSPRLAFSKARDIFNQKYKQALSGVEIDASDNLLDDLSSIVASAKQSAGMAGEKKAADFENTVIQQVLGRVKDGKLTGEAIQEIQQKIGQEAMRFGKSTDPIDGKIAEALTELDVSMMDLIAKYSPANKELLQKTNRAYSQFVPLRAAQAKATEGVFTPAQAMSAVRAEERKAGAAGLGRLAAGEGRMQKPIEMAQRIIGPSLPDSGTAGRLLTGAALYGGGGALVGAPGDMSPEGAILGLAGGMLGRGATTRLGQFGMKRGAIPAAAAGLRAPATSGLLAQQVGPMIPQAQASSLEDMAAGGNIVGYESGVDRQGNPFTFAKMSDGRAVRVR